MNSVHLRHGSLFAVVIVLVALLVPAAPAFASHPAGSCIDVEPETATNPVGTTHTLTVTLKTLSGQNCTGANTTPDQGQLQVHFDIEGPNDPDGTGAMGAPDLTCSMNNNASSCTVNYDGLTAGQDTIVAWIDEDNDDTPDGNETQDTVTKDWTVGAAARLDCDDAAGPDTERETNPTNAGTASNEVYTCTVTDAGGNVVTAATTVNAEVENNVNDPDATDGASYNSPDYTCSTTNGSCQITVTQNETETGTAEICFWVGTAAEGTTLCGAEATGESQVAGGSDTGNDLADQVEKTWQGPTSATRLDCTLETDTNPAGTGHTVQCVARDSNNALIPNAPIDAEATGANDPDAGNTPLSPDFSCTTDQNGVCTFTHGTGGSGTTNSAGTTTYRVWIDTDANNATTEADTTEGRDETTTAGGTAEPDGTDVVEKTWTGGAAALEMTPATDTGAVGDCNAFTITVRDSGGAPVPGVTVDVEQRHDLAINQTTNDEPDVDFCVPTSGPNPSDVNTNQGDLNESPDNRGTIGGETQAVTDANGQVTIGITVAPANNSNGTGNVTVTAFAETTDNDDADQGEPSDTSMKTWVLPAARTIDCEPETASPNTGSTHTIVCTVRTISGAPMSGVSVTFTETGPGDFTTSTTVITDNNGEAGIGVTSNAAGDQTVTGTITESTQGEPNVDECDRAANDPAGAPAGVCADSVTVSWQAGGFVCPTGAICGTAGNDTLAGTPGDDVIYGLEGDDTIDGGGGSDIIVGGPGDDTLNGGDGSDILKGSGGSDTLNGGAKSDLLIGGGGPDTLNGGGGDDLLQGGGANDRLFGNGGDDLLNGGTGSDVCRGGPGRDRNKKC